MKKLALLVLVGLAAVFASPASASPYSSRLGWPTEKTVWIPKGTPLPAGMFSRDICRCCGSMRPTLFGGETAYWQKYDGKSKLAGFIVWLPDRTHRVVAETDEAVLTEGDNNRFSDGWTSKKKIVAVLRFIVQS